MAKGDLGEYYSILGTAQQTSFNAQRKALEDERKRARRDRYLSYLVEPIIGAVGKEIVSMVKSPFEEKYKDFANSAVATQQKVKAGKIKSAGDIFQTEKKQRANYIGGEDAWLINDGDKEAEREMILNDPEYGQAKIDSGHYKVVLAERSAQIQAAKRKEIKIEEELYNNWEATGDSSKVLKNMRTKTAMGRVIDVFQRDSTEKQDARAQEAYEKTPAYKEGEAYLTYIVAREQGKTFLEAATAASLAKKESLDIGWNEDFELTTTSTLIDTDGNRKFVTTTAIYNNTSDQWKNGRNPISTTSTEAETLTATAEAKIEADLVRSANGQFNYTTRAKQDFTPKAYEAYVDAADKEGIDITNIKTIEERNKLSKIFTGLNKLENFKEEAATAAAQKIRDEELMADLMTNDTRFIATSRAYKDRDMTKEKDKVNIDLTNRYIDEVERLQLALVEAKKAVAGEKLERPVPEEGDTGSDLTGKPIIFKGGKWVPDTTGGV